MPVVIFFVCLDLEQKPSFLDGHYLKNWICKECFTPNRKTAPVRRW